MQNKNLKLKLSLCGLALTSFLALNARSVVHADTVQNGNANNNAITWNSDSDDSQIVKEEPQQDKVSQPAQKKIMVADVSSAPSSQKRAEMSNLRQSNVQTSTVNRLSANKSQANIKVSNVQDVAQASVQKQKVAQFNQGSKIYTLNGSNQLSKNNGDGYVITNAGTYNGRAVDIGVTINSVQDNQGTYTTKWSNGDKADVTGKTDANFKYQDSVLMGQQSISPNVPNKTRTRYESKAMNCPYTFMYTDDDFGHNSTSFKTDKFFTDSVYGSLASYHGDYYETIKSLVKIEASPNVSFFGPTSNSALDELVRTKANSFSGVEAYTFNWNDPTASDPNTSATYGAVRVRRNDGSYTYNDLEPVTDHLQLASSTPASLGYNYTVGLYDAQTGELITDLKAEYNSKAGVQATAKDSVMNNAIKSKIQQINQNKATVSYTGTRANDDVVFYKETRAVNPQDQSLHKSATRIISVNLPDDASAKARYKGILNANDQVVQTINFTRTGVENVVNGQVTYGAWQGPSSFGAVTLPDIPGYTMTMN